MISSLLFVCVGNVCRSPMAEGLFKERLKHLNLQFKISSAGLHALVNQPAVCEAQEVMCNIGIDISHHRAQQLSDKLVLSYDLILVMDKLQKRKIELISPYLRGKVHLLGKWSNFEVSDPYYESITVFNDCLKLIEQGWNDWKQIVI